MYCKVKEFSKPSSKLLLKLQTKHDFGVILGDGWFVFKHKKRFFPLYY